MKYQHAFIGHRPSAVATVTRSQGVQKKEGGGGFYLSGGRERQNARLSAISLILTSGRVDYIEIW